MNNVEEQIALKGAFVSTNDIKSKIKKLTIPSTEIARFRGEEAREYIKNKLIAAGFDMNRKIIYKEDEITYKRVYTQEEGPDDNS